MNSCFLQVGNIGGKEFSESLAPDVQKLLVKTTEFFTPIYPHLMGVGTHSSYLFSDFK